MGDCGCRGGVGGNESEVSPLPTLDHPHSLVVSSNIKHTMVKKFISCFTLVPFLRVFVIRHECHAHLEQLEAYNGNN